MNPSRVEPSSRGRDVATASLAVPFDATHTSRILRLVVHERAKTEWLLAEDYRALGLLRYTLKCRVVLGAVRERRFDDSVPRGRAGGEQSFSNCKLSIHALGLTIRLGLRSQSLPADDDITVSNEPRLNWRTRMATSFTRCILSLISSRSQRKTLPGLGGCTFPERRVHHSDALWTIARTRRRATVPPFADAERTFCPELSGYRWFYISETSVIPPVETYHFFFFFSTKREVSFINDNVR